jgi:hypothetical protein
MKKFSYLLALAAIVIPTSASSQSIGDLLVSSIKSKGMKKICLQQDFLNYFTATAFGFYPNGASRDQLADELALEITAASSTQWSFADWRGNSLEGSCHMNISITLPAEYASHFGGDPVLQGDMYINIVDNDGVWKIRSISDSPGQGTNSFLEYARPFTRTILQNRKDQARLAEQQEDNRRQAEAEAARQEWIRTHPKEYAAEQIAARQRDARYQELVDAKEAENARRAKACESNGGTWGRRTNGYGVPIGAVGCFFQTVRN